MGWIRIELWREKALVCNRGIRDYKIIIMKNFSKILFAALVTGMMVLSCSEPIKEYGELEPLDGSKAIVKVIIGSAYPNNPLMYVKANGRRITPKILMRQPYPGGGYGTNGNATNEFILLDNGETTFELGLPKKVDDGTDSIIYHSKKYNLEAGGKYTVLFADTGANTVSTMIKEDLTIPDSATFRYQIINMFPNVESVDLYVGRWASGTTAPNHSSELDTLIASDIRFMQVSEPFILRSGFRRTFKVRPHGAEVIESTVLARYSSSATSSANYFEYLDRKVLTIFTMGYDGQTTNAMMPYPSFSITR